MGRPESRHRAARGGAVDHARSRHREPWMSRADRRTALAAPTASRSSPRSASRAPGPLDVDPCENGYREAVVRADIDVPTSPVHRPDRPRARAAAGLRARGCASGPESVPVAQHAPRIAAARPARLRRRGTRRKARAARDPPRRQPRPLASRLQLPVRVSDNLAGGVDRAAIPRSRSRAAAFYVVWQEFASGRNDDAGPHHARAPERGREGRRDVRVDDDDDASGEVAADGRGGIVAARRRRGSTSAIMRPTASRSSTCTPRAASRRQRASDRAVRVDAGAPVAAGAPQRQQVGADDRRASHRGARRRGRTSGATTGTSTPRALDGGQTYGPNVRIDDFPDAIERVNERPTICDRPTRHGARRVDGPAGARGRDTNIFYARRVSTTGSRASRTSSSTIRRSASIRTRTRRRTSGIPAWRSTGAGSSSRGRTTGSGTTTSFSTTAVDAGIALTPAERVGDTGTGTSEQTRPSLAIGGRAAAKARATSRGKTGRNGNRDIYVSHRPLRGLVPTRATAPRRPGR